MMMTGFLLAVVVAAVAGTFSVDTYLRGRANHNTQAVTG